MGEQILQPGVPGLLRGSDENTEIVRHDRYDNGSSCFREGEELVSVLSALRVSG
jgi:hypothetical protein